MIDFIKKAPKKALFCDFCIFGAVGGNRTPDLTLTKRLLYHLSYNGLKENGLWRKPQRARILSQAFRVPHVQMVQIAYFTQPQELNADGLRPLHPPPT